jgi:hypothetical protein
VIAEAEGKLESINAWDLDAGVSLGPIQINCHRGALFRFLWSLWAEDHDLFAAELSGPLGWSMRWDGDHPDLQIRASDGSVTTLHGRADQASVSENARYFQTGDPHAQGRDGPFRRTVATQLRNCVVWPHVQELIERVSTWWLDPHVHLIRRNGIGPLDPTRPDRDTYVLTALLLSAAVRYSGCLGRILRGLGAWNTATDKLAHWEAAVRAAAPPCPDLVDRLTHQEVDARRVFQQVSAIAPGPAVDVEAVDISAGVVPPTRPAAPLVSVLPPDRLKAAAAWNAARHPSDSGISIADIAGRVTAFVGTEAVAAAVGAADGGSQEVTAEAVHQLQAAIFADAVQHDGKAGPATLDALGFVPRRRMNPSRAVNTTAQRRLDRASAQLEALTGGEYSATSWWDGMMNPPFLGRQFHNGVHALLVRRLRMAEGELLGQSRFAGLTPVALGRKLGIAEEHKGARPTRHTMSMHTFGLAVDIMYGTNPWVVGQHVDRLEGVPTPAGEVTMRANRATTRAVNRAVLLVDGEVVSFDGAYLSSLARLTTGEAWDVLYRRHAALLDYLGCAGMPAVALPYVRARQSAGTAGVIGAGEDALAAAERWSRMAAEDLDALRLQSVRRKDRSGHEIDVPQSTFAGRDPTRGFLNLARELVIALRDVAGLAWGAIDFGPHESGDVMHFDTRRDPVGALLMATKAR